WLETTKEDTMLGSKKGITPIVATIILIAFSFLIGTVVMAWGEKYIEDSADFVEGAHKMSAGCDAVEVHAYSIDSINQVCDQDGTFQAILENGPDIAVKDVQIKLIGTRNVHTAESTISQDMEPTAVQQVSFSHPDIGRPRQVKFTPKIEVNGNVVFCADKNTVVKTFDCSWT
ncbi:MAG: hypothetical protein QGG83_04960, partial [Candidatus Woesearchaeota archaeon]|nr:hypothetical protein [Candidatus Woesearchaeota archaeon]